MKLQTVAASVSALALAVTLAVGSHSAPVAAETSITEAAPNAIADSRSYNVDGGHSVLVFAIKHLDVAPFFGRFNKVEGSYKLDSNDTKGSFVKISIPTESIDSNSDGRDRHLKSQDFFNVKQFPTMTFESSSVKALGGDRYEVAGELELLGKKRPVTIAVTHTGSGKVNDRFGHRSGFEASFKIKRSDFGMSWGVAQKVLGDEVRIMAGIEGVPQG